MRRRLVSLASAVSLLALICTTAVAMLMLRWRAQSDSTAIEVQGHDWLQQHRRFGGMAV